MVVVEQLPVWILLHLITYLLNFLSKISWQNGSLSSGTSSGGRLIKEYCPGDNTTNQLDLFSKTHELYIRLKKSDQDEQDITVQALRGLYSFHF